MFGIRWRGGHDRDGGPRAGAGPVEGLNGWEQAEDKVQGKTYAGGYVGWGRCLLLRTTLGWAGLVVA